MAAVKDKLPEIKGETATGFAFCISGETVDNMELVDALSEMDDGNELAMSKALRLLLGDNQKKALYDHVRTEDGRVPIKAIASELKEIFQSTGKSGKNS